MSPPKFSRPKNILILRADQQRPDTIGAYGNALARTPNFDRLAAGSAIYEQAYCAQPVCSPSRASLLTGLYPQGHGVLGDNVVLPDSVPTLAEMLQPAGYVCGHVGIWHLGREHSPQRGFDFWRSTEAKDGYPPGDPLMGTLSAYDQSPPAFYYTAAGVRDASSITAPAT